MAERKIVDADGPVLDHDAAEASLPFAIDRLGDDKILFTSDYPNWDGMFPHVVSTIPGHKAISDQTKAKVLGEIAQRIYEWSE